MGYFPLFCIFNQLVSPQLSFSKFVIFFDLHIQKEDNVLKLNLISHLKCVCFINSG